MDVSELRLHALRQAADDTRTTIAGNFVHATPEVITARAEAYLDFLFNGMPPQKPKVKITAKKR